MRRGQPLVRVRDRQSELDGTMPGAIADVVVKRFVSKPCDWRGSARRQSRIWADVPREVASERGGAAGGGSADEQRGYGRRGGGRVGNSWAKGLEDTDLFTSR